MQVARSIYFIADVLCKRTKVRYCRQLPLDEQLTFGVLAKDKSDLRVLREEHQITLQGSLAMVCTARIPQLNGNVHRHLLHIVAGYVGAALWDVRVCFLPG